MIYKETSLKGIAYLVTLLPPLNLYVEERKKNLLPVSISILAQEIFMMQAFGAVIIWTVLGVFTKCPEAIGFLSPVSIRHENDLQKPEVHTHPLPLNGCLAGCVTSSQQHDSCHPTSTPCCSGTAQHCSPRAAGFSLGRGERGNGKGEREASGLECWQAITKIHDEIK